MSTEVSHPRPISTVRCSPLVALVVQVELNLSHHIKLSHIPAVIPAYQTSGSTPPRWLATAAVTPGFSCSPSHPPSCRP
jgi:hypothetical protein